MALEDIVHSSDLRVRARRAPPGPHLDDILSRIESVGYRSSSLRDLVHGVIQFGDYLHEQGLSHLSQLRRQHLTSFIATQQFRQCRGKYRYRISRGVWGARHLWRYTCATGITPAEQASPPPIYASLFEEWLDFMQRHRGLAPKSLAN